MRRRLLLLAASFAVLLAAFGLYLAFAGGGRGGREQRRALQELAEGPRQSPQAEGNASDTWKGTEFRAFDRDKDGRLKAAFFAPQWQRQDDGSYLLIQPSAVLYQKGGQQIHIQGQRGVMYVSSDEVYRQDAIGSSRFRIRRGRLDGNVVVIYDRATAADRSPPDQRPDDVVRIDTEDVEINSDELMLFTNGRVKVVSSEAYISGEGMSIRWNEDPQEIRTLRLERGDYMKVYYVGENQDVLSLPGGAARVSSSESPAAAGGAATRNTATSSTSTVTPTTDNARIASQQTSSPGHREAQNIYRATFSGDVTVDQGARKIHGADTLSLDFQWERGPLEDSRASPSQRKQSAGSAPGGAKPPESVAASRPAARMVGSAPTSAPASRPGRGEPILVKWTGPLVINAAGYTDAPSRKNLAASGQGREVVLSDSQATATCRRFEFHQPGGRGELAGEPNAPALLVTANNERVVCPLIKFDLQAGSAQLAGAGYMTRPGKAVETNAPTLPPVASSIDRIQWQQSVDIQLAGDAKRGSGLASQYIKQATFHGDVDLLEGASGNRMTCRELTVWPGRKDDKQSIARAVATGDVRATGKQDAQEWLAKADRLEADGAAQSAVLFGQPASVSRGQELVSGPEIHLAQKDGTAKVVGGGRMNLISDRNLSGEKTGAPRPVEITWTRQMEYSDGAGLATFDGAVCLVSGPERMDCDRQMRVVFQKVPKNQAASGGAVAAAAKPAEAKPTEPSKSSGVLTLGAKSYGGQLSHVYADDSVVLGSLRQDDQDRLLGKTELKGKNLIYDAIGRHMDIGRGTLFVQDFRPPRQDRTSQQNAQTVGMEVESPSQTYFEWSRSMRLAMEERMVTMVGDVWMRHYSGDKIVNRTAMERDLKLPAWPAKLPSGRASDLLCENLVARFAAPEPNAAAKAPAVASTGPASQPAEGMEAGLKLVGALDVFIATGSVLMVDGLYEVTGERVSYDRASDIVLVRGFLEGQTPALATVTTRDPPTTTESEWIKWYRHTNAWETGRISGAGTVVGPPSKH